MNLRLFVAVLVLISTTAFAQKPVSVESLLNEMINHGERARFPEPAFTCKQFSSYDRATVAKDDPGGWFANDDRSMFIRVEKLNGRREFVMMDAEGPGAIVRFRMTFAGNNAGRKQIIYNQRLQCHPATEYGRESSQSGTSVAFHCNGNYF